MMNAIRTTVMLFLGYAACIPASGKSEDVVAQQGGFSLKLNRVVQPSQRDQAPSTAASDAKKHSSRRLHQVQATDISMEIQNYANVQYLADVCFGNPPQLYKAAFDTGSSNTWLLNPKRPFNSSSAEYTQQKAQVYFGSGALQGHFLVDEVRIGNGCEKAAASNGASKDVTNNLIDIKKQQIGVAEQVKGFQKIQFDAIIGMAYPSLAQQNVTTVFDNIIKEKVLSKNIFSFYVVDDREEKLGGLQSEISFGYIDSKKYTGNIKWHPVLFKYMYGMKLDDIIINNKSLGFGCAQKECLVTIDSGTSHLAFPEWAIEKVAGHVPLQTKGIACTTSEIFGDLTFIINGESYTLPNNDWTFEPEKGKDNNLICRAAIRQRDLKKDMFVLGDIFLRNFYTVFDRDNDRVGLAEKVTINSKQ